MITLVAFDAATLSLFNVRAGDMASVLTGSLLGAFELLADWLSWVLLAFALIALDWGCLVEGEWDCFVGTVTGSVLGMLSKLKCPLAALAGFGECRSEGDED